MRSFRHTIDSVRRLVRDRRGATLVEASLIGLPGNNATIPADLPTRAGDTIISAEVYFNFVPLFNNILLTPKTLYRSAYVRPRLGSLTTIE